MLPEIKRAWPAARVVLFSSNVDSPLGIDLRLAALALGASAVVQKLDGVGALVAALRAGETD